MTVTDQRPAAAAPVEVSGSVQVALEVNGVHHIVGLKPRVSLLDALPRTTSNWRKASAATPC